MSRIITLEVDGEEFAVDALEYEDPTEEMVLCITALANGHEPSLFEIVRLLGVDNTGWRVSKTRKFFEALEAATELKPGESSGSGKSSEPTGKKLSSN